MMHNNIIYAYTWQHGQKNADKFYEYCDSGDHGSEKAMRCWLCGCKYCDHLLNDSNIHNVHSTNTLNNIQYVHVMFDGNAFYFFYLLSKACMGDGISISGV